MRAFYRLVQFEFSSWFRAIGLLGLGIVISPLLLLYSATNYYNGGAWAYERYEDLYISSGCAAVFLVFLAAACAYFLKTVYGQYWGSKSIYTYLALPVRREAVYASKLAVFIGALLILLALQLVSIRLGYSFVAARVSDYSEGKIVMHNGMYLAFIRSEFFRLLLPLGFSRILSTLSLLIAIATSVYYGALCERSKKYAGFAAIAAAYFIGLRVVAYRLGEEMNTHSPSDLYSSSLLLLLLSAFFVWHSIWLIKKGAVA